MDFTIQNCEEMANERVHGRRVAASLGEALASIAAEFPGGFDFWMKLRWETNDMS